MAHRDPMNTDPITAQRGLELVSRLRSHGWHVVERTRDGIDWWADELWTIESEWSPNDRRGYLTFLTDPMGDGVVWALAATATRPAERREAESGALIRVRHEWDESLAEWLTKVDELRANVTPRSGAGGQ